MFVVHGQQVALRSATVPRGARAGCDLRSTAPCVVCPRACRVVWRTTERMYVLGRRVLAMWRQCLLCISQLVTFRSPRCRVWRAGFGLVLRTPSVLLPPWLQSRVARGRTHVRLGPPCAEYALSTVAVPVVHGELRGHVSTMLPVRWHDTPTRPPR